MDKLVFLHMPKCAGRSIKEFLKQNSKNYLEMNNMPFLAKMTDEELSQHDVIGGHISFEYLKRLNDYKFVTWLRDPLERTISQYNHFMTDKTSVPEAGLLKAHKLSFRDFVTTSNPNLALWVNIYTVQLGDDGGVIYNIREYLKRAIEHLNRIDFIGLFENMDKSFKNFKEKFGLKGELETVGKTPDAHKVAELSDEDVRIAKRWLAPDYMLYNMARKRGDYA